MCYADNSNSDMTGRDWVIIKDWVVKDGSTAELIFKLRFKWKFKHVEIWQKKHSEQRGPL